MGWLIFLHLEHFCLFPPSFTDSATGLWRSLISVLLSSTAVFVPLLLQVADLIDYPTLLKRYEDNPCHRPLNISKLRCPSEQCVYKDTRHHHTKTSLLSVSDTHIGSPESHSKTSNLSQSVLSSQSSPVSHNSAEKCVYLHIIQTGLQISTINRVITPDSLVCVFTRIQAYTSPLWHFFTVSRCKWFKWCMTYHLLKT